MFEVLIREAAARFGVGDKALPLVQMLLAAITAKDTGGLAGFLDKFKAAGLGPLVQSWLGGGEGAQSISNVQIETVLGNSLLPALTAQLGLPRDPITPTIGYLLPALIGRLTPGGSLPANLPAEIASHAQTGQGLLAQATQALQATQRTGTPGGGLIRLVGVIVIVIVLAALYAWSTDHRQAPQPIHVPAVPAAAGTTSAPLNALPASAASAADSAASAASTAN
jgi:uncharacterized protein YidB (DUF937 family)